MDSRRLRRRQRARQDMREIAATAVYVIRAICICACLIAAATATVLAVIHGDLIHATLPGSIATLLSYLAPSHLTRSP